MNSVHDLAVFPDRAVEDCNAINDALKTIRNTYPTDEIKGGVNDKPIHPQSGPRPSANAAERSAPDHQPVQVSSIASRSKRELVANIVALAKIGRLYDLPTVLATVNVKTGINQPTIHQVTDVLGGLEPIDRTSINAWEDNEFVAAVKATGRKKLIMAALWTEVCLVLPALDALKEGDLPLNFHPAAIRASAVDTPFGAV
jgi:Isochorismatase family